MGKKTKDKKKHLLPNYNYLFLYTQIHTTRCFGRSICLVSFFHLFLVSQRLGGLSLSSLAYNQLGLLSDFRLLSSTIHFVNNAGLIHKYISQTGNSFFTSYPPPEKVTTCTWWKYLVLNKQEFGTFQNSSQYNKRKRKKIRGWFYLWISLVPRMVQTKTNSFLHKFNIV